MCQFASSDVTLLDNDHMTTYSYLIGYDVSALETVFVQFESFSGLLLKTAFSQTSPAVCST